MNPQIFLFSLALIWMIFAVIHDLRKREIADWLNFSLLVFALGFRFFYSLFSENFSFFIQGVLGLAIFFILGNMLYKAKLFAGGDAKLMISLGAILPIYPLFIDNLKLFGVFLLLFLFLGAIYGLLGSIVIVSRNFNGFKKEFSKQFKANKKIVCVSLVCAILLSLLAYIEYIVLFLSILIFISPYLYIYAKAVDESCMIKNLKPRELTEGDWLYKNIKIGNKTIKANWDGLTKEQIRLIRKYSKGRSIKIRYGIPFSPAFLISFIALIYLLKISLASYFPFLP